MTQLYKAQLGEIVRAKQKEKEKKKESIKQAALMVTPTTSKPPEQQAMPNSQVTAQTQAPAVTNAPVQIPAIQLALVEYVYPDGFQGPQGYRVIGQVTQGRGRERGRGFLWGGLMQGNLRQSMAAERC